MHLTANEVVLMSHYLKCDINYRASTFKIWLQFKRTWTTYTIATTKQMFKGLDKSRPANLHGGLPCKCALVPAMCFNVQENGNMR